jgi:phosphatidate cytidylyltransferase
MLKTRVISSIVLLVLLFGVVELGHIAFGIAVFLIAIVGMYEFYNAVSAAGHRPVRIPGYLSCLPIFFIGLEGYYGKVDSYLSLFGSLGRFSIGLYVILFLVFMFMIFKHNSHSLEDMAFTLFGTLYVAFQFAFIVILRNQAGGIYYIWLVFIGAWMTDTSAYFIGKFFGKRKLLPVVSPNKTVAGTVAGVIGCVVSVLIYGLIVKSYIPRLAVYDFIILGTICGVVSQLGDWGASAIKRYTGIKDFGKIFPGHGGVLDRFDSILFVAPVVYFYINYLVG